MVRAQVGLDPAVTSLNASSPIPSRSSTLASPDSCPQDEEQRVSVADCWSSGAPSGPELSPNVSGRP
jgi:hypothetical protein